MGQPGGSGAGEGHEGGLSLADWLGPADDDCNGCGGVGWVCENHQLQPYDDAAGCWLCKLGNSNGIPCPTCRPQCHLHAPMLGGPVQVLEA